MTASSSTDLSDFLDQHLAQASPGLLRHDVGVSCGWEQGQKARR